MRRGPLTLAVAAFAAALALVVAGCGTTPAGGDATTPPARAEASADVAPGVVPTKVVVASIGAASTLDPVGLNPDNTLQVPPVTRPQQAAWFRYSPVPGVTGPAVLLGHINGGGRPGVFAQLAQVKPGAAIDVDRSDGTTAEFTVTRVDLVPKNQFPTAAVYSDTANSQVRLISCGGDLDSSAHSYVDNVVVYGDLVGAHRT